MSRAKVETSSITIIRVLKSIEQIKKLNTIGVFSVRDLAEYTPCRHAEILIGFTANRNLDELSLTDYVNEETVSKLENGTISNVNDEDISVLDSVEESIRSVFTEVFDIDTIEELANFNAFSEAKDIIQAEIDKQFHEKPSAPNALIPKVIGSTHTMARFSNYVKENVQIIKGTSLKFYADSDEPRPAAELREIFYRSRFKFHFGYLSSFKQKWINAGTHLGEIVHSLALAPGESRNIAFIEWQTRQTSSRQEDTEASELLESEFLQHRALNEVVKATAQEHLYGETEIDATTKTTGYGLTTGFGAGASAGASGKADLTAIVGFPLQVAGAGLVSAAGSLGGSLVHSKGTTQGTLKSETTGERSVNGEVIQDISDSTVQNSSNIRSLMSTVVVDDEQSGSQKTYTRNVTNYNHSHALTIQYYEVLQKYKTNTFCDGLTPVLYLPFNPMAFDIELIKKYWAVLMRPIKQAVTKTKFKKYNATVRDFKAENGMFDASGDVRVTKVKIVTSYSFSSGVRVEIKDASPDVKLKIKQTDMDECLTFKLEGSSTHVDYELLDDLTFSKSDFDGRDSFEVDEGVTAVLKSRFKTELKEQMKRYLGDSDLTPKVSETNREDNELGHGNNRDNLKQNVNDGNYSILNGGQTVDFTMNIEYSLEDIAGNEETIQQTYSDSLSFSNLHNGYNETILNATDHINDQLGDVSDINSANEVEELESYFETYKYSFTKYLLSYLEKEQVIDIIDHLALDSALSNVPLTSIIDPNPLGIVENLMIFKLKEPDSTVTYNEGDKFSFVANHKSSNSDEAESLVGYGLKKEVIKGGKKHTNYRIVSENRTGILNPVNHVNKPLYEYDITISDEPNENSNYEYFGKVITKSISQGITNTDTKEISGETKKPGLKSLKLDYEVSAEGSPSLPRRRVDRDIGVMNISFDGKFDFKPFKGKSVTSVVEDYLEELDSYEDKLGKTSEKGTVFLPTSGVFAEAILGISNASEYINISRFYNWQDSPIPNSAPQISPVNANQDYSDAVSNQLQPNIPVSVLNQISPQQMPGTSLDTALGAVQNGSMFNDMSKTDQFVTALSDLASLANNSAQLAGTLSGEAAENALNAAVELGKQVAGMVNTAMGTNIASPPSSPTAKGGVKNAMEGMETNPDGTISPVDNAIAGGLGTPVKEPCDKNEPAPAPVPTPTPTPDPTVDEDKLEIKTNSISYSSATWIVKYLKALVPEDILQLKDVSDVLSLIEHHVQYGGNLNVKGNVKLTANGVENKRSFYMYGKTVAVKSFSPAGGVSSWHEFFRDDQITDLEELNGSHYDVTFLAGDISEILATLTDIISPLSALVNSLEQIASLPDTSMLPQWAIDWIDSNTFLSNMADLMDFCQGLIDAFNDLIVLIENDLQASGLYVRAKGEFNWTFIGEANNTIGTCVITSFGTAHDMQMDIIPE